MVPPPYCRFDGKSVLDDNMYHLTVTLNPRYYDLRPIEQYRLSLEKLSKLFSTYGKGLLICAIPELTKDFNIHYHCLIQYDMRLIDPNVEYRLVGKMGRMRVKPMTWIVRNLFRGNKYFGFIKIDKVSDYQNYTNYMFKDLVTTYELLDIVPDWLQEQDCIPPIELNTLLSNIDIGLILQRINNEKL